MLPTYVNPKFSNCFSIIDRKEHTQTTHIIVQSNVIFHLPYAGDKTRIAAFSTAHSICTWGFCGNLTPLGLLCCLYDDREEDSERYSGRPLYSLLCAREFHSRWCKWCFSKQIPLLSWFTESYSSWQNPRGIEIAAFWLSSCCSWEELKRCC